MRKTTSSCALYLAAFVQMLGVGLIVSLLPGRVISLSGSMDDVGFIASFFAIPFVVLQIPAGRLSDRFGCRLLLAAGCMLAGFTGLLYYSARSILEILAARAIQGIAEIPAWALGPALLSTLFPDARGEVIGRYNASFHLGLMAGSLAPVLAPSLRTGNTAFLLYSVAGFFSAAVILAFVRDPAQIACEGKNVSFQDFRSVLSSIYRIRRPELYAGICLYGGAYGAFLTVVPGVLIGEKNFGQGGVTIFFALFYVAVSISQDIAGRFSDKKGRTHAMITGLVLAAGGMATFMLFNGTMVFLALFAASCGLGVFCVASLALLGDSAPASMKGVASAIFYVFWGAGFFLLPPLLTWLGRPLGYSATFFLFSTVMIVETAMLYRGESSRSGRNIKC